MKRFLLTAAAGAALLAVTPDARAQSFINSPGRHAMRPEVELHGILNPVGCGWSSCWGGGWGAGVRVGIPLLYNGPVPGLNNSLHLGLGGDLLVYNWGDRYNRYGYAGALAPVLSTTLQWNFYLLGALSLFVEGGLAAGIDVCSGDGCGFWLWPGLAVGGRVHFRGGADYPALTFRLGFPTGINLGISF